MAISKLNLQFGPLISVPIRIENLVGDGTKPKGNYVCKESHVPITSSGGTPGTAGKPATRSCGVDHDGTPCVQTVGYPIADDTWYVPDEATLEAIKADSDREVTFYNRVPADQVDPAYFDTTYAVRPDGDANAVATKALWVFADALKKQNRVMIGTATLGSDEKMVVLRWSEPFQCLMLCLGVFDEQIKYDKIAATTASRIDAGKATKAEIDMATQILEATPEEPFDAKKIQPTRWHALNTLIAEAAAGKTPVAKKAKPAKAPMDLAGLMQQSIDAANTSKPKVKA